MEEPHQKESAKQLAKQLLSLEKRTKDDGGALVVDLVDVVEVDSVEEEAVVVEEVE